jgi:hypothetical protein
MLYDDQRNAQKGIDNPMSEGKIMLLFEGVAFAVGLLVLAGATYLMAIEAIRKAKQSQSSS